MSEETNKNKVIWAYNEEDALRTAMIKMDVEEGIAKIDFEEDTIEFRVNTVIPISVIKEIIDRYSEARMVAIGSCSYVPSNKK